MYSRTILRTNLTPPEAERQLASLVRPPQSLSQRLADRLALAGHKPFVGNVKDGRFTIYRVVPGLRGFAVIATGRIEARPGGADLPMLLRVAAPVAIFQIAWLLGIVGMMSVRSIDSILFGLLGLLMAATTLGYFFYEKRTMLRLLQDAFPGSVLCKDAVR